jgi:PPP family 3-phenylpropionic acid transporter
VHRYFGSQHQGKGQALYNSFSAGLGGMVGSYASGYYFDLIGATGIYTASALCCALALLLTSIWIGRESGN